MPEGGLLLYGGFDNERNVLSDCWRLDLSSGKNSFVDVLLADCRTAESNLALSTHKLIFFYPIFFY
jgi:hypothetical protein